MARTDAAAAINATTEPIVTYHTDPRGWSFFYRLAAFIQRGPAGTAGRITLNPVGEFTGYARAQAGMHGMGYLGAARPMAPRSSTLSAERESTPLNDTALGIFAERMARGRR